LLKRTDRGEEIEWEGLTMEEEKNVGRRNFLSIAISAIGALISAALGIPAVAYIVGPALKRDEEQNWISLGSISKVELNKPTLFKSRIQRQTGWIVNEEELSVYLLTNNGRDFVAISNICTHLGCRVRWIEDQNRFFCPCHNAVFDKDGKVVSGPPPRPLDQYEVKVEDEQIFILGG
jgi:menaquinol-cytochrome c reductase iron-sulfur subunit